MGGVFDSVVELSSGVVEWVIVGGPVLIEVNGIGVGLLGLRYSYVREVPSGTVFNSNSHSVTGGYLLNSERVE